MSDAELVGLQEIATIAGVTASAVANWRKRFPDFPTPVVELKAGPVFHTGQVRLWLGKRQSGELRTSTQFYEQLAGKRSDDNDLMMSIEEAVRLLVDMRTSTRSPGVLLGKVQSGKTRAYLGIIARAFDRGYDVAVILTKGTKSLARQTLSRVADDFSEFIEADRVQVYDIMSVPELTPYELAQRLVFVVKKEDDNLKRLLSAFKETYPDLQGKRVLIVDDEADFASVTFRKQPGGVIGVGKIQGQIDELRELTADSDFLQVTATPYSLYLQPEDEIVLSGSPVTPKRPKFSVILPTHKDYVGGEYYFEKSTDPTSPAYFFYREVPLTEREALKKQDRRRLKIENVLSEQRAAVLVDAMMAFVVGGSIRRMRALATAQKREKYSFLFHTEQTRQSHEWQQVVATAIRDGLVSEAEQDTPRFNELLHRAMADLRRSVNLLGTPLPEYAELKAETIRALVEGELMITKVNSDKDIDELLDGNGQLKLRTPFNMFIGGQILDRGVTINNLIGFYYGRNPNRFQQDTVLQHSRMYGVRPLADLAVTRFYAPQHVYKVMQKIHAFDAALREAFVSGAHDRGVYFIQKDSQNRVVPCSPNKLLASKVVSIRPGRRLLPIGFQTVAKSDGRRSLSALDGRIADITAPSPAEPLLVSVDTAIELLERAYDNLEFEIASDSEKKAHAAALEHLSRITSNSENRGKVWLMTARDRNVSRYREEGRFSDAPDTKQQSEVAVAKAVDIPVLMLLRQNGEEANGWRGFPFWWPVIVTPSTAVTSIFATDVQSET
jgi:hypothetical protein